jgi:phage tail-like protein
MARELPYGAFNYTVKFDRSEDDFGGFSEVSGLGTELTIAEYRNGNDPENHVRNVPGLHKPTDITCKRGIIDSSVLWAWFKEAHTAGPDAKKDVTVTLMDESRNAVQSWVMLGVLPMKYTGPSLTAKGGEDVAVEEIVLKIDNFDIEVA